MPRTDVPDLPEEIQRQIVQLLSAKACCNAANACKAFYQWANAVCTINATTVFPNRRNLSSLVLFQERRCQMGLRVQFLVSKASTAQWLQRVAGRCYNVSKANT